MPLIQSPAEVIARSCTELASCFQAFYNLFFSLLIVICFINFFYGATLYLISSAVTGKIEEGKNKMKNSIIALVIALVIPTILNTINPDIFKEHTFLVPTIVGISVFEEEPARISETYEKDKNIDISVTPVEPGKTVGIGKVIDERSPLFEESLSEINLGVLTGYYGCPGPPHFDVRNIFREGQLKKIRFMNNDPGPKDKPGDTEYINPKLAPYIIRFDEELIRLFSQYPEMNLCVYIEDGWSWCGHEHKSNDHNFYGTALDITIKSCDRAKYKLKTSHILWGEVKKIARKVGFDVYDERHKGSPHLHIVIDKYIAGKIIPVEAYKPGAD